MLVVFPSLAVLFCVLFAGAASTLISWSTPHGYHRHTPPEMAAFVDSGSLDMFSRNAGYYPQLRCSEL
jgi:hypothetical protein